MPLYESVFIARQDVSSAQVDSLADQFTSLIQEGGGEIKKREYWGLRNLAYRMKKNRKGHYVLFNIDGPAAAVHEMERNMRINEDVIRYLTVKVDELEEEPSAMMRSRGGRDDRGGRRPGGRFGGHGGDGRGPRGGRDDGGRPPQAAQVGGDGAQSPKEQSPKEQSPKEETSKTAAAEGGAQ